MRLTRGIRNNNPANIRRSSSHWIGLITQQNGWKDKSFCQFSEMRFGVRALVCLLRTYYCKHHLKSVHDIILRYAPTSENNTYAYIKSVSASVNVDSWQDLCLFDSMGQIVNQMNLFCLCHSICWIESQYILTYDFFSSVVLPIL